MAAVVDVVVAAHAVAAAGFHVAAVAVAVFPVAAAVVDFRAAAAVGRGVGEVFPGLRAVAAVVGIRVPREEEAAEHPARRVAELAAPVAEAGAIG